MMATEALKKDPQTTALPAFTLTRAEAGALTATFAGWALDGMDVMAYSFAMPALIVLWHLSKSEGGLLSTSALLVSAIGGWAAGLAADRWGRVKVLQATILWFAFFTFLSGFTQNFTQLLTVRGLQGLGFGGEWAVGSVLIGETIRKEHRGRAVGIVQSGWAVGWGMAAGAYTILFSFMQPALAWRALFWIGILPSLLVFYIGRRVHEPDVFKARKSESGSRASILEIFGGAIYRRTLLASLVALGAQGGFYAVTTWLPLYLSSVRHLPVLAAGSYLSVVIAGSLAGYLTSAYLADKVGRKKTLVLFSICSFVMVCAYMTLPISNKTMLLLGAPLGFFPSGSFSPMGSFFTELFPTRIRASAQGFSYNLGRGVGAFFPVLVGNLSGHMDLGFAIAIFSAIAYLLMVIGVVALPETRGLDLGH